MKSCAPQSGWLAGWFVTRNIVYMHVVLLFAAVGPAKKKRKRSPAQCQPKNAVCALNELRPGLTYNTVSMTGPVHAPIFTISVEVGGSHK
jgi:hypothetical protein